MLSKARKIETETCLQQAERLEALRKTKPDLRLTHRQLVNKENCNGLPKYMNKNVKLRDCMSNVKGYSLKYNIYVHFAGSFLY